LISKNDQKLLRKLRMKKHREQMSLFVAEGPKVVSELLQTGFVAEKIWATDSDFHPKAIQVDLGAIKSVSTLESSSGVLAIFRKGPTEQPINAQRTLLLDGVRDPGNMGTLLRLADWFGLDQVICSPDCVDIWNPKTIQAAMGSIGRVPVLRQELTVVASGLKANGIPLIAAVLNGQPLYQLKEIPKAFALCMGSESHGIISLAAEDFQVPLTIPRAPGRFTESLNVAMATGIILGWMCQTMDS
jgi:RNA methyltransferase, TrmH family